jgi:hypothetical protein
MWREYAAYYQKDGRPELIWANQELIDTGTGSNILGLAGPDSLMTKDGRKLRKLGRGTYQLATGAIIFSDDPESP